MLFGTGPHGTFAECYAGLSPAEARQFLVDLYTARGWETTVEGDIVCARRDGVERCVRPAKGAPDSVAPEVVTLDATAIHEMARYALDRETRRGLYEAYFGRAALDAHEADWSGSDAPLLDLLSGSSWRSAAGALALVLVLAGVVGTLVVGSPGLGPSVSAGGPDGSAGAVMTDTGRKSAGFQDIGRPGYPPGLSPAGVDNPPMLAITHERILENTTYTWTLTYEVVDGNDTLGRYRGTVRVSSGRVYAVDTERTGNVSSVGFRVGEEVYADGVTEWYPANGTRCTRPIDGASEYTERAGKYVGLLLRANNSLITDRTLGNGSARYTVTLRGDPWPNVNTTSGHVRVGEGGRIHRLRRVARRPSDGAKVVVTLRFSDLGTTSVSPPDWINETRGVPSGCYTTGS